MTSYALGMHHKHIWTKISGLLQPFLPIPSLVDRHRLLDWQLQPTVQMVILFFFPPWPLSRFIGFFYLQHRFSNMQTLFRTYGSPSQGGGRISICCGRARCHWSRGCFFGDAWQVPSLWGSNLWSVESHLPLALDVWLHQRQFFIWCGLVYVPRSFLVKFQVFYSFNSLVIDLGNFFGCMVNSRVDYPNTQCFFFWVGYWALRTIWNEHNLAYLGWHSL